MYELRAEAIDALTSKSAQAVSEATPPESWDFKNFAVLRSANTVHVQFRGGQDFDEAGATELRGEFTQIADRLVRDSKVLLDFAEVKSFSAASIAAIVQFNQKLKNKGSRIAICCLDPKVQESFFEKNNGHD